jgi:2,3,4,5-tetrahydropyridine-2-carboxylate N-succinyltransferase
MDQEAVLQTVEDLYEQNQDEDLVYDELAPEEQYAMDEFVDLLQDGDVRVAEPAYDDDWETVDEWRQGWNVNEQAKKGVLAQFGLREIRGQPDGAVTYNDMLGVRNGEDFPEATRNVPSDTTVREGAYLGNDVTMMSPAYVNIGAHVGDGTLIDSHDTVGSASQIGEDVKLGANMLVGGVLSPVEDEPVIIEDGASLGGGSVITSGFRMGEDSVAGENTLLTPRLPVYDFPTGEVEYGHVLPERQVFNRQVESSLSERPEFETDFFGPAIVALDADEDVQEELKGAEELSFE